MIRSNANLEELIYERSRQLDNMPKRMTELENGADADEQTGLNQLFATCGEQYDFDRGEMLQTNLTTREAQYIKRHIEMSPASKDSLLAYLLREGTQVAPYYPELASLWQELPMQFQEQYRLARHFSYWAYYMHLRYRYLFAKGNEDSERAARYEEMMQACLDEHPEILDANMMGLVLTHVWTRMNEESVHHFCRKAAEYLAKGDTGKLDTLIRQRERQIKGNRNKIDNPKFKAYEMTDPRVMTFRWDEIVYRVITEIREALCHNEEIH